MAVLMSDVAGTEKFYDSIQQDVIVVFDERIKSTQLILGSVYGSLFCHQIWTLKALGQKNTSGFNWTCQNVIFDE